jgi:hypothetical protein
MSATVTYIANGFSIAGMGMPGGPSSYYAATIPEVIYWLAVTFEPAPAALAARMPGEVSAPRTINPTDPLIGQEAVVWPMVSGGYMVRQQPRASTPMVDQWCASMDDVHGVLNLIFAPPAAQ